MGNGSISNFVSGFSFKIDIDKLFKFIKDYDIITILYNIIKSLV